MAHIRYTTILHVTHIDFDYKNFNQYNFLNESIESLEYVFVCIIPYPVIVFFALFKLCNEIHHVLNQLTNRSGSL